MSISWDENQLPALSSLLEQKLPLTEGVVTVCTMDIPDNCFAGQIDLEEKEFIVYCNLNSPLSDVTVNVFLGYIVALAYDKAGWSGLPPHDILFDCHRQVCQTLLGFNEEFSRVVEEHADVLEAWHQNNATTDPTTATVDADTLVDGMGAALFSTNPVDSKNYGSN